MRRSVLTEVVLTDLSRRRALDEAESRTLEAAIVDQLEPKLDRRGNPRARRYNGRFV